MAHAFLRGYSDTSLKLAQLMGQLGIFLTWVLKYMMKPTSILNSSSLSSPESSSSAIRKPLSTSISSILGQSCFSAARASSVPISPL